MFEAIIENNKYNNYCEYTEDFIVGLEEIMRQDKALKAELCKLDPYIRLKLILFNTVTKDNEKFKGSLCESLTTEIKDLDFRSIINIARYLEIDLTNNNIYESKNISIISNMLSKWHVWRGLGLYRNSDVVLTKTKEYVFNKHDFIDDLGYPVF